MMLKKKVEVIEHVKKNHGVSYRNVGEVFQYGKTLIQSILLQRDTILAEYMGSGLSSEIKLHRTPEYTEVNNAVYKWYSLAREWCISVSGPLLQKEALHVAKRIDPNTTLKLQMGGI